MTNGNTVSPGGSGKAVLLTKVLLQFWKLKKLSHPAAKPVNELCRGTGLFPAEEKLRGKTGTENAAPILLLAE